MELRPVDHSVPDSDYKKAPSRTSLASHKIYPAYSARGEGKQIYGRKNRCAASLLLERCIADELLETVSGYVDSVDHADSASRG